VVREEPAVPEPEPIPPAPVRETVAAKPAPPPPPAPVVLPAPPPARPGTILGTVRVTGAVPARKPIRMDADPKCAARHESPPLADDLVIGRKGGVRWAFVYVKRGLNDRRYEPPTFPVLLEQVGCMYRPHVFGIQAGQPLVVRNGDDLLHNIHFVTFANPEYGLAQATPGREDTIRFRSPEVMVRVKCDVHPWMSAWAGVLDHPFFAVTDEQGGYGIPGLPPGRYVVDVWHERLRGESREIDVSDAGQAEADFLLQWKSDSR
jgi:hypothetical protein